MANFADPFLFTVLLAIVSIGITLVGAVIIDYFGRRTLFIWSACITWITLILIGTLGVAIKNMPGSVERFVVFLSMVWRMASTILGDLGWSYVAEAGSSRLRTKTAGFAACGGVLFGLLFNSTVPYMISQDAANW
jgi:SP family general alpha glucoside:H+ symporter-like MFS transporter